MRYGLLSFESKSAEIFTKIKDSYERFCRKYHKQLHQVKLKFDLQYECSDATVLIKVSTK